MDISALLQSSKKVWLSTHISADGDGLGSEMAFYHALKKSGYPVQVVHNDKTPKRYEFLTEGTEIIDASALQDNPFSSQDICFIFDTHDSKLCQPLIKYLEKAKTKVVFIDHHITMKTGAYEAIFHIDENASCTGELTLDLIEKLKIPLDSKIAACLYASLIFDTQNFKNMRSPVRILDMGKKLIEAGADHAQIHWHLFENWTVSKLNYLSKLITTVTYKNNDTAIINISKSDLKEFNLSTDEVSDIVDLFMGLKNLNVSIVVREESTDYFKLSFRSRKNEILSWAREFGGGGHLYSAGAWVSATKSQILEKLDTLITKNA